jgi:ABC-type transport system involved in multi-copper enzyme maturation permease subunit
LVSSAGAAVIARDVATKAMTMYLSRPIRPIDYLAAKSGAVAFWVFLGGVLPGWVASIIVLALGYVPLTLALQAIGAYFAVGLFSILAFTGLAVLFSSLTPRTTLAGAGTLGALLGSYVVVAALSGISGKTVFLYVSPVEDVLAVGAAVFGVGGNPLNPGSSAVILILLALSAFGLAYFRLRRNQVISE